MVEHHQSAVNVFAHFHEREIPTNLNALRPADNDDLLIQPKKLVNPVTDSKDHRNLNREIKINSKLGIDVLNQKSELSKVFAERGRAKKNSPLHEKPAKSEFELMMEKRRQGVEKLEQEKAEEENVPEFVKMQRRINKSNSTSSEEES